MKNYKECIQALLDGETLVSDYGVEVFLNDRSGKLSTKANFCFPEIWKIKKYRLKTLKEFMETEDVTLSNNNELCKKGYLTTAPLRMLVEGVDATFTINEGEVQFENEWDIRPWMCVEVHSESKE